MKSLCLCAAALVAATSLQAQAPVADSTKAKADTAVIIKGIEITAAPSDQVAVKPLQLLTLPTTASLTIRQARQTVNIVDTEDAVKYLPSVMMRKRNNGDTQAVMGTRIWGIGGSARSLVFADGIPLSNLLGNNNTFASPRWGLVAPVEIARIDMMNGPYSAAYSGNSMGAVMEITTRLPTRFEGSLSQTHALQAHNLYGTKKTFSTMQTSASLGNRFGKLSVWASGNYQDSHSQPIGYVTSGTFPGGTTGGFAAQNKLGAAANILGATGLLHTHMINGKIKAVYDFTPAIRAAYSFGVWRNNAQSGVQSYLMSAAGQPTFAGQAGFASGFYDLYQFHTSHTLSLRSDAKKDWDFDISGAHFKWHKDRQRVPTTSAAADTTYSTAGRVASNAGTGWYTADAKATWHRGGLGVAAHTVSFGGHVDHYGLENATFNTPDWRTGNTTSVATAGNGKTRNLAVWAQDGWQMTARLRVTIGARVESWRAFDGFNQNGSTQVSQPAVNAARVSPKLVADWRVSRGWSITFSGGQAYRFPTASELYQLVSTGTTFTSPAPDLRPENVLSGELRIQRRFEQGQAQVAFFGQDVRDAIISQFLPLVAGSPTLYSYLSNVDHVRAGGIELLAVHNRLLIPGLQASGYVTWLDARTLALSGRASATAAPDAAIGKFLPNIPRWRTGFTTTYRTGDLSFSFAGRYSSMLYTTLDNADVKNPNVYQGFTGWFVADSKATYTRERWSVGIGVDNLFNRTYFLFHPFPQRTFVADLKVSL